MNISALRYLYVNKNVTDDCQCRAKHRVIGCLLVRCYPDDLLFNSTT